MPPQNGCAFAMVQGKAADALLAWNLCRSRRNGSEIKRKNLSLLDVSSNSVVMVLQKQGRGNHRRFGYEAVHIAAILAELSRYGMNTMGLRNLSSRLWDAVNLGRLHPDFTPLDFMCCKNLLIGKELAARGEDVPGIMSIGSALARDDDHGEKEGTPGPRHVKMMKWFSIDAARLLTAYADLMSRDIFLHDVPKWFVSASANGSIEFILEDDPSGEDVEGRASYICLDIKEIVNRAWFSLTDQ
ncbi:hypothetical protein [Sphingomonas sp. Leaf242]|uniref:hypothetical protein n=1 Tax=Sphingomonas sp. Leaf242 TaxID=1736304 RepID=UPI0012E1EAD0|nr:hypothetical protein [Sphingomonas sp. Leaf242]